MPQILSFLSWKAALSQTFILFHRQVACRVCGQKTLLWFFLTCFWKKSHVKKKQARMTNLVQFFVQNSE